MKDILSALMTIKQSTGLEIDLYSAGGELLLTTNEILPEYKFKLLKPADFHQGTFIDYDCGVTYFSVKQGGNFTGVIMGANEISRNYAVMVQALIVSVMTATKTSVDTNERFKMLLSGELSAVQVSALKSTLSDKPFNYYMLTIMTNQQKMTELKDFLQTVSDKDDIIVPYDDKTICYLRKCGLDDEYQSASDFANILYDNIKEELRIVITISVGGTIHNFDELVPVFGHSLFAYNFGKIMEPNNNIYSYKEYIMIKLLSDIPKSTLIQYLDTLIDKNSIDIFCDSELMDTAEVFLKNSLNISETSRGMYMHRNTLIYRLDKIENATGLNIRHFNDALIFRLTTILHKLTGNIKK